MIPDLRSLVKDDEEPEYVSSEMTFFPAPAYLLIEGTNTPDHPNEVWIQFSDMGGKFHRLRVVVNK